MSHWWRAHDDAIDNAKLCLLSDRHHRAWFNLCCLASANNGVLPELKVLVLKLRMPASKVSKILSDLKDARLFDDDGGGAVTPHAWEERQFKNSVSTERVKRFRKRKRNGLDETHETVSWNADETHGETHQSTETDTETERKKDKKYVFECGIILLVEKDLTAWIAAFSYLDVKAELTGMSKWAGEQGTNWFNAVSGLLAKRNREAKLALEKPNKPRSPHWTDAIA